MQSLHKEIENYNGQITESNLDNIANLINLEQRLKLSEDQVKMVTKRFLE